MRPLDCSPPGSPGHGISQARILEWVAISHSRGSSQPRDGTRVSYVSCIGRKVLDHLSYQGSLLKPSSGINPRRSRDSNVKGEATGSLEANVECTHLLDAGKALHKSSNKPRKILIVTVILSCLFIKRGHQKSESEPKDGRRWSQHTKLMKRVSGLHKRLQGLHEERWRGRARAPSAQGVRALGPQPISLRLGRHHREVESHGKCLRSGLFGEGWRRGRTNSYRNVNFLKCVFSNCCSVPSSAW